LVIRVVALAALAATLLGVVACGSGDTSRAESATAPATTATTATQRARPARTGVRLVSVGHFNSPVYVTAPPGDRRRIFVVEQAGAIRVVRGGNRLSRPFLDLRSLVLSGGEQGLLSLAFAPDYARTRRFYVDYTDKQGLQRVVEYRRSRSSADRALPSSARTVLTYDGLEANHNGGLLLFGPDRRMYIGTGDGGGGNDQHGTRGNAQDLGSLLGKILRIDPRASGGRPYSVPSSNPFVGRAGARPEIYSYGLRNPWRFSFDPANGDLTIADVGQDAIEEIDFTPRAEAPGANYGWRPFEGTRRVYDEPAPGAVQPVIQLTHDAGNCSVTGGYVVRDKAVPALFGRYVYGDLCKGQLRSARLRPGSARGDAAIPGVPKVEQLSSFGEDALGRVYAVSLTGPVYRFAAR
jgi:glucose/arabinose dehydrogenase